jgi:hypothetical protein
MPARKRLDTVQHETVYHVFDECPTRKAREREGCDLCPTLACTCRHQEGRQTGNGGEEQREVGQIGCLAVLHREDSPELALSDIHVRGCSFTDVSETL